MNIKKGTSLITLKSIRPWAPFSFRRIPAGAKGVVFETYTNVYPRIGAKPLKIRFAHVAFKWTDKAGHRRSAESPVCIDLGECGKSFRIIK